MSYSAKVYNILIASPSDLLQERKIIPDIIYAWNAINSIKYEVLLAPILWESHSTPEMGDRPQEIINRQIVKDSDILIGVFWTRIGTHTGKEESGTVEEIKEFILANKPVLLYFSSQPVKPESIDQTQYNKLIEFKNECTAKGLVFSYDSISVFREMVLKHLTSTINKIHSQSNTPITNIPDSKQDIIKAYRTQFHSFIRRFEAEWVAERDSEPYNIEEGKLIISRAFDDIITFKTQIQSDPGTGLLDSLTEASKRMKQLQRHKLYLDGGASLRAFWEEGNIIIELLKKALKIIDDNMD